MPEQTAWSKQLTFTDTTYSVTLTSYLNPNNREKTLATFNSDLPPGKTAEKYRLATEPETLLERWVSCIMAGGWGGSCWGSSSPCRCSVPWGPQYLTYGCAATQTVEVRNGWWLCIIFWPSVCGTRARWRGWLGVVFTSVGQLRYCHFHCSGRVIFVHRDFIRVLFAVGLVSLCIWLFMVRWWC